MKNFILILFLLFHISCGYNSNNTNIKNNEKSVYYSEDSIKCKIIKKTEHYARIETDTQVQKDKLQGIAKALRVNSNIIYYHITGFDMPGEEYGNIINGNAIVFDDINKEKLIKQRQRREQERAEQIRKNGIRDEDFAQKAFIVSQTFVKNRLKSPKSADFPFSDYKFSNRFGNTITIESYVDAVNSFNAEIRTNYRIKLELKSGDWSNVNNWSVINFDFY